MTPFKSPATSESRERIASVVWRTCSSTALIIVDADTALGNRHRLLIRLGFDRRHAQLEGGDLDIVGIRPGLEHEERAHAAHRQHQQVHREIRSHPVEKSAGHKG